MLSLRSGYGFNIYRLKINRYAYAFNNPLKYTDPSGEFIAFTKQGYEFWKTVSPIAIKINFHWGTTQNGIGVDVSIGIPKCLGISYITRIIHHNSCD